MISDVDSFCVSAIVSIYHNRSHRPSQVVYSVLFKPQQIQVGSATPALDSTALWKFEKLEPQWGGDDLKSGAVYRMKNVATGLYLRESQVLFTAA